MVNQKKNITELLQDISGGAVDPDTTCIKVSGKDANKFLQGQLSNDIENIDSSTYQISSFLTNQGKVISILRILRIKDGFLILINKEAAEYFIQKISIYILNSNVNLNIMDNFLVYGVLADISEKTLKKFKIDKAYKFIKYEKNNIWILNNTSKNYKSMIIVDGDGLGTRISENGLDFKKSDKNILKITDTLEKYLRINDKNKERYIPQVLSIDELNGISFKKGCYTGQEIVARTHYLGKVKKKIYLTMAEKEILSIDEKIYNQDNEFLGEIISESIQIGNYYYNLAIIKIDIEDKEYFSKDTPINIIY